MSAPKKHECEKIEFDITQRSVLAVCGCGWRQMFGSLIRAYEEAREHQILNKAVKGNAIKITARRRREAGESTR